MSSLAAVKSIAVLYSNKGGMADVGKFVIDHAEQELDPTCG